VKKSRDKRGHDDSVFARYNFRMKSSPANMLIALVRQVWEYVAPYRPRMALVYALSFAANVVLSIQPIFLAQIINTAQKGGPEALHDTLWWSAAYAGLNLGFWLLHGPSRVMERRLAFIVFRNFVTTLYGKVTEMPLRWHQDHHSGGIINRVNKAGRALFTFSQNQFVILQSLVRFGASLLALAWYSWWVALVSVIASVLIGVAIRRFDRTIVPLVKKTSEREHHLNAALYDYIGNILTVLTLRLQSNTAAEIGGRFDAMRPSFWREVVVNEWKWASASFVLVMVQAGITGLYIAVGLLRGEPLAMGSVVAIFQYLMIIAQLFFQGMMVYENLVYQHTDVHGVDGILEDHARLGVTVAADRTRKWEKIKIEGLSFTHREGEEVLHHLRDINLEVKAGSRVAFIGTSGSGKTTLLTLLRGLYEPQHVRLTIDGDTYEDLKPLGAFTTLVPQDSEVFENTILYNLTLGTEVPQDVIDQAMAVTTFDAIAAKLPQGVWTDIRERGVNLSGGQKQRLALTRGLIAARDSSLLLFDEPTSSVDMGTESAIFDKLFAAMKDKTIVASIHRLHLLPRFDHIVFMQNGVILEQGPFLDLLAHHGAFNLLWRQHLAQNMSALDADKKEKV
jgi:ABC-type multidrug transport system fused ATPase/permease subunit